MAAVKRVKAKAVTKAKPAPVRTPEGWHQVAGLLEQSVKLHQDARAVKGQRPGAWKQLVHEAYLLRAEAERLDPQRVAHAWVEEQRVTPSGADTHNALMGFYKSLGFGG